MFQNRILDLIKLANNLDNKNLSKRADQLDNLLIKIAQEKDTPLDDYGYYNDKYDLNELLDLEKSKNNQHVISYPPHQNGGYDILKKYPNIEKDQQNKKPEAHLFPHGNNFMLEYNPFEVNLDYPVSNLTPEFDDTLIYRLPWHDNQITIYDLQKHLQQLHPNINFIFYPTYEDYIGY